VRESPARISHAHLPAAVIGSRRHDEREAVLFEWLHRRAARPAAPAAEVGDGAELDPSGLRGDLREVIHISFPIIIGMASHTVMTFADAFMVSCLPDGNRQLAAIGPAGSAFFTFAVLVLGTARGTATFVSQSFGRGRRRECARYAWQGLYFAFLAQAVAGLLWPVAPRFFGLFPHDPEIRGFETTYFQIRLLHILGTASYAVLSSYFQGTHRPKVPMVCAIVANVINLIANYVLIFGKLGLPAMGLKGAAIGTVIASYVQAGALLYFFLRVAERRRYGTDKNVGLDPARFARLMRVGLPIGISFMLDLGSWAIFALFIIGSLGSDMMAAHTAAISLMRLSFMPAVGLNQGVTALVGRHIGEGDFARAHRRYHAALVLGIGYMTFMGAVFFLFRHGLIGIFRAEPEIVTAGATILIFAAIFQAFDGLGIITHGALRGAGDTVFPAAVAIIMSWLVFLPLGYFLTQVVDWGVAGAWLAATVNIILVSVILFARFSGGKWREIDVFRGVDPE